MTGLRWVRLDATFPMNPKVMQLADSKRHRAGLVYVCGLAYSGWQGTDGHIARHVLPLIHGRPVDAAHLVDAGLWKPNGDGWQIHDWHQYQPTTETTVDRSDQARRAAYIRWGKLQPP